LCCCLIQVIYTRIIVKWGIRYIDEGFLIWIILSKCLSHEAVNWACTIGFACIRFYSILSILWCFLSLGDSSGYMKSGYGDMRLIYIYTYIHEGFLVWIIPLGLYNWCCHIYFIYYLLACSCMLVLTTQFFNAYL